MDDKFFEKQTRSSRIKANIVAEYFPKYCNILMRYPQTEIRYLDLFAGPGIYEDGSHSTPMLIGKLCQKDSGLKNVVRLMFNDNEQIEKLKTNFESYFSDDVFTFKPRFGNKTVGKDEKIHTYLSQEIIAKKNPHPTLLFVDPYGYKGINTLALAKFLSHWGNEIFLFLNIKRIHAATENKKFDELMNDLFPTTIASIRQNRKYKSSVPERLSLIIENLANEFRNVLKSELFCTSFKFQEEDNVATSNYILHFTKHPRGFDLVKQIFHDFDNIGATLENDGTYAFDAKRLDMQESSMLEFDDTNVQILSQQLRNKYKNQKLTAKFLFDDHQSSTRFCRYHYTKTLRKMVENGEVTAIFTDNSKHEVTVLINENCLLEFK